MPTLYHATVFVHVLSAVVWLGGMFGLAVLAPILRKTDDPAARQRIFQAVGSRFRTVGWICIVLLVVTGIAQLQFRGWWGWVIWGSADFWRTNVGHDLAAKLGLVTLMFVLQAVHDFRDGPRAGRIDPTSEEARRLRKRAALLARVNAVLGVGVIWFAVALVRGL
jgi:uncharacterized membrane protein